MQKLLSGKKNNRKQITAKILMMSGGALTAAGAIPFLSSKFLKNHKIGGRIAGIFGFALFGSGYFLKNKQQKKSPQG